jgi:hypothetical protein
MKPDEACGLIFSWDNVIVSSLLVLVYYSVLFIKCSDGIPALKLIVITLQF